MRHRHSKRGYIMVETVVAIVILGVSAITIQGVIREAIRTRAQVQDYTHVRFLLEEFIAQKELQPVLFEDRGEGIFDDGTGRFRYTYSVEPMLVPPPVFPAPLAPPEVPIPKFQYNADAFLLVRVSITASWTRGETDFEETMEILLPQERFVAPQQSGNAPL